MILDQIVDHTYEQPEGTQARRSTKGWKLCVTWRDGSTSWEPLYRLKESNPVNVAEYAV
jgi:hypothetical protein